MKPPGSPCVSWFVIFEIILIEKKHNCKDNSCRAFPKSCVIISMTVRVFLHIWPINHKSSLKAKTNNLSLYIVCEYFSVTPTAALSQY